MLAKSQKLNLGKTPVREALRRYSKIQTPHLIILIGREQGPKGMIVVGKHIATKATQRNYLKRRLYEGLERIFGQNQQIGVVARVKKPGSVQEILQEIRGIVGQIA